MSERFADLHFARPELWPIGAAACVALVVLAAFAAWRRRRALSRFASSDVAAALTASVSSGRRATKLVLLLLALAAGFAALAQPRWGYHLEERERRGVDVLFAIDTSRSMLASDLRPDRLTRAKLAVRDLVRELPGDRAGLVAFAGESFLQCPMTLDRAVFERSLDELDTTIIPRGGTDLAAAIRESIAAFGESEHEKLLVLLTDGEALEGDAVEAAEQARASGVRIFAIGVGSAAGSLVTVPGPEGEPMLLRGPTGELVRSALDEPALRRIADVTGGAYRALGASGRGLAELYATHLAHLPRHAVAARMERVHHEQFQWPLGLAILFLLMEPLLGERRRAPRVPRMVLASGVAAVVLVLLASRAFASPLDAHRAYQRGAYREAARLWADAAARERSPELRFNHGTAAYRAGDFDGAARAFASAVESAAPSLQQRAYYDLGNAHYRRGEAVVESDRERTKAAWRSAIRAYESALALDRTDADAQHNLELVRSRLAALEEESLSTQQQRGGEQSQGEQQQGEARGQQGSERSQGGEQRGESQGGEPRGESEGEGEGSELRGESQSGEPQGGGEGAELRGESQGTAQQGESEARGESEGERGESPGREQGDEESQPGEREGDPQGEPQRDAQDGPRSRHGDRGSDERERAAGSGARGEDGEGEPAEGVVAGSTGFGGDPGRLSRERALEILRTMRHEQRRFPLTERAGGREPTDAQRRDW